jgi:hypothetical protein
VSSTTDALLHKAVSFDVSTEVGKSIVSQLRCSVASSSLRDNSIVGTVSRKVSNRVSSGNIIYEVAWNNSEFGTTEMSHSNVCLGMSNYMQLQHNSHVPRSAQRLQKPVQRGTPRSDPYNTQEIMKIIDRSRIEDPELSPYGSDCGSCGSMGSEDTFGEAFFGATHTDRVRASEDIVDNDYLLVSDDDSNGVPDLQRTNVDELDGLEWDPRATLEPRLEKMLPKPCSIKPQYLHHFASPLAAFSAFLPQGMFEKIQFESNKYARKKLANSESGRISGNTWKHDISIQEMMQFMGILIYMTLLPVPGRDYRYYWSLPHIYKWVGCMKLSRFKQIRSVLHFNSSDSNTKSSDPLHWVRPIYATIQETIGRYVDVGSEFSLDEATAACRSSFGRHLIVYNPTKNCGKFHFRF